MDETRTESMHAPMHEHVVEPTEAQPDAAEEFHARRAERWRAALDDLEFRALRAIDDPDAVAEWAPHPSLGPMPVELVSELGRVIETYRRTIVRLTAERSALAAELRASSRAAALAPAPAAVFLDVRG